MPVYHRLGDVPPKRHSIYRRPDGELYSEELMGNKGFVGPSSLLYHLERPTQVLRVHTIAELDWSTELNRCLKHRHFRTHRLHPGNSLISGRIPLLFNSDVALS